MTWRSARQRLLAWLLGTVASDLADTPPIRLTDVQRRRAMAESEWQAAAEQQSGVVRTMRSAREAERRTVAAIVERSKRL